jgi:uncharacterized protein (DUF433 family)
MADLVSTEGVMGGQPRIEGHRISVLQVAEWILEEGLAPETVSSEFDLDLADVYRALAYYYDNVEELDEHRERRRERVENSEAEQPSPDSFTETA